MAIGGGGYGGIDNPCRHCVKPERYEACHDECPKYAAYQKEIEKAKANRRKDKQGYRKVGKV